MIFFEDSESLNDYVKKNNVVTWHGDIGLGSLLFIDNPKIHVVFNNRDEYELWDLNGRPVNLQLSLF